MKSLLELREAARALPFENPHRVKLFNASDAVWTAVCKLRNDVTADNIQNVVGQWANAQRVLQEATKPPTPPLAGAPEAGLEDLLAA